MSFDDRYRDWKRKKRRAGGTGMDGYIDWQIRKGKININDEVEKIYTDVSSWYDNYKSFVEKHNARYKDGNTTYRGDSQTWLDSIGADGSALSAQAREIRERINRYGKYLDPGWSSYVQKQFFNSDTMYKNIYNVAKSDHYYQSKFESQANYDFQKAMYEGDIDAAQEIFEKNFAGTDSEEKYKNHLDAYKDAEEVEKEREGWKNYDLEGNSTKLEELIKRQDYYEKYYGYNNLEDAVPDKASKIGALKKDYFDNVLSEEERKDLWKKWAEKNGLENFANDYNEFSSWAAENGENPNDTAAFLAWAEENGKNTHNSNKFNHINSTNHANTGGFPSGVSIPDGSSAVKQPFVTPWDMIEFEDYSDEIARLDDEIATAQDYKRLYDFFETANKDPDFDKYSQYDGSRFDRLEYSTVSPMYSEMAIVYHYINSSEDRKNEISDNYSSRINPTIDDIQKQHFLELCDEMTPDEKQMFNYLYSGPYSDDRYIAQYDETSAELYFNYLRDTLEKRYNDKLSEKATSSFGAGLAYSGYSVALNLMSPVELSNDFFNYIDDYSRDPNTAALDTNTFAAQTNVIRGAISEELSFEIAGFDAGAFLYNTAMSGVDSLAATAIGGKAGGVILGLSAAAHGVNDGLERGMSNEQAFWNGAIQGVFEGLFESVSIGKFKSLQEATVKGGKDICLNIVKSMIVNASEEACTELANILYDTIVNGSLANYTWEELENGAWMDAMAQIAEAAASGAIMGLGFGGIASAGNSISNVTGTISAGKTYKSDLAQRGTSIGNVTSDVLGLENKKTAFGKNTAAYKQAQKIQSRLDKGKNASNYSIGKLALSMSESQMRSAIQTRLSAHIDNDADLRSMSRTIADIALGREVSNRALSKVAENKYALNALNDVIGAKLRQGATVSDVKAAIKSYQESSSAKSGADVTGKAQSSSKAKKSGASGVKFSMSEAQDGGFDVTASSDSSTETVGHFDSQKQAEAAVYAMTLEIGPDGTRGFISMAENINGVDIGDAAIVYNAIYNQGKSGKAFSAVKNMNLLSPEQRQLAYRYGVMDHVAGDSKAEKTSHKVLQKDGKNDTIESTQSRRENSDGKESESRLLSRNTVSDSGGHSKISSEGKGASRDVDSSRVHGESGRIGVLSEDSEERRISSDTLSKISETAIVDEDGKPISLYHATDKSFDKFTVGDIGFHFGLKEQADSRAHRKNIAHPRYINAYLNIKNPLKVNSDYMNWHANSVALNLWNEGVLSDAEMQEVVSLWSQGKNYNSPAAIKLREILESKGYDGIAYPNGFEGDGTSYIAFHDEQIVRVDNGDTSGDQSSDGAAIRQYKSSESYKINEAIRSGRELTAEESAFIEELDRDLEKTPKYSGVTYRNISFDMQGQEAFDAFVAEHVEGELITYNAYTSTSKSETGYVVDGELTAHIEIYGENGHDISQGYGLEKEQEVLYGRKTRFVVTSVSYDGKTANIVMEEFANGERAIQRGIEGNKPTQQGHNTSNIKSSMQQMQESLPEESDDNLQDVSQRSTRRDSGQRSDLQGVRGEVSTDADPDVQQSKGDNSEWSTERIEGGKAEKARPVSEIIEQIRHDFGINITKGHVRGKGVLGQYSRRNHGIRTKIANDLPTVAHELGHALDQRYGLTDNSKLTKEMRSELVNALGDLKGSYKQNLWVSEGLAEYMRRFLQNRDDAARTYPEFTKYFLNSLSKADRVLIDTFADEINAYYALDGDTATSSIRLREEGVPDARTPLEKARDMGDGVYQAWVDANHGIRLFDEATGANTYKLASNAAYSDAIAGQIITGDLTDANGQYVAPGLKAALEGVNIGDKKIYREFGEYLVLRHGPERLNEGMRIFADERKNNAAFMEKRAGELEAAHPEFKEAADRLYTFQKQFLKTWAVDTGLLPSEVAEEWAKRWSFYVPLNRAVGKAGTVGAKRGYANQNSTVKKAIGSGLDIVHPVDNIINNIVKMVNAGVRNNVMLEITAQAKAVGADATFLEEVPTPMKKKTADLTGVKAKLHDAFGAAGIGELLAEVEGESEYSYHKTFSEQIDDVVSGKHDPVYDLYVGKTPDVLINIGFDNKPLLMRNSKIKEILSKHSEMSIDLIKKIPDAISDPVMILKSKTNPTESVVVITDIMTDKGHMIIPVWVSQDGTYLDVEIGKSINEKTNFVATAYGRNVKGLIEYALSNNEVLFYAEDKKRVSSLLATHGLQLPARLSISNSTISISHKTADVNKKNSTNSESKKSDAWSQVDEIIESAIDDVLIQYGQGKAHGDVVTVLRNGKQEFWKINDALLLESLTNLSQKKMNGIMEAYAVVSRFMTSNITGNNIIWSIFSNFPRDMMTFFTYSKQKNPLKAFPAMGEAYLNKVTGGKAETKNLPYIKEYHALGGGQTSAYTADVDLAKRARKKLKHSTKLQSAAYYANPLNVLSFVSETVESGPRIATYIMMREKGMSPQEAFYESQDITVNFKRGGRLSREFNKVVPFFNASVQGLDKFKRWITCDDVPKAQRAKAIVGRVTIYVAVSAALGALIYGLNNSDEEDKENYRLLSNYTKNTYWNIPLGDGKYFAIPKPREIAVLSTFIETTCEYFGGDDYAYGEFGDYVADNFLPPFLSDLVTDGMDGALGSLGIIGVAFHLGANKDFLGRPIESTSLQGYESQDRYTRRTSQIAYWLGQAAAELGLDWSPEQIDYFFSQTLGGYWKVQKALFPVGSENVDWTLGVQNTYIKDNLYSNDIVNWMYDKAASSAQSAKSNPDNVDIAIEAKLDSNMKSFYSRYYALTKGQKEDAAARRAKRVVLDMIVEYRKASDNGDESETQKVIYDLIDRCHDTSLLPSVMQTKVKDADGNEHSLRDYQYVEYQTTYTALYWGYVEDNLGGNETDVEMIAIIKKAQTIAKERATQKALESVGAGSSGYFEKYPGIDDSDLITFQSQMDIETDKDGGLSQEELIDILDGMVADGLSKEDAYTLFKSQFESDKNNPWRFYSP